MNIKKILSYSFGPFGAALIGFITLPIMTWYYTQEDVGKYNLFQIMISLSIIVVSCGMHQSYVREYHELENKNELIKPSLFPGTLAIILLILVSYFTKFSLSFILFDVYNKELELYLFLAIVCSFYINILTHILRMKERAIAFSMTKLLPKITFFIALILIVSFDNYRSYLELIKLTAFTLLISLVIFIYLLRKDLTAGLKASFRNVLMIKMLKFGSPLIIGGLAYWALTAVDRILLKEMSGFEEVAIYSVSTSIVSALSILTTIFASIWHPKIYHWAREGIDKAKIELIVNTTCITVILIWTFVGIFSWVVDCFLPSDYSQVSSLIIGCVAMPLIYLLSETTVIGIGISKKTIYSVYCSVTAFLINIVLNYLLIPEYMALGAVVASLISFLVLFILRTEFSCLTWMSIKRTKVYISVLSLCLITIIHISDLIAYKYMVAIWIMNLLMSIYFHKKTIKVLYKVLISKYIGQNT
ncbi:oligosaccharide flippase family protein [Pseudoalteromonas sp. APC 3355]|uniref:lipopolysaccharide biosynthesis protein n=1 Tax=Pseudoalteromonas sp. APC 3355 TaxID=3035199 RepID=UPI0025B359DD|nr:oligosaccharide flippase family protein [Pseudoalteromonas sp. APC 3355]MDN3475547.1 oligosaccharide flippase family protein [Pseudoalteromonas sp. APC 3355]